MKRLMPTTHLEQLDLLPSWYWWFRNRILSAADLARNERAPYRFYVDFGTGPGGTAREFIAELRKRGLLSEGLQAIGIEGDQRLAPLIEKNGLQPMILDFEKPQEIPGEFDFFTAFDLLEHLEHPEVLLRNIRQRAQPGAVGLVTVPSMKILWSDWDDKMRHYRRYEKDELIEVLSDAGFEVLKCHPLFSWVVGPALWRKWKRSKTRTHDSTGESEFPPVNAWVNQFALTLSRIEWKFNFLPIRHGTSLIALAKVPSAASR